MKNHTIKFSVPENPTIEVSTSNLQKCGILLFLPEDRLRVRVFFGFCFSRGDCINNPSISGEGAFERKLKILVPFLSGQKDWRATSPPPTPIYSPKLSDQNFEIVILFSIVERSNNYVFRCKMTPPLQSVLKENLPWGE